MRIFFTYYKIVSYIPYIKIYIIKLIISYKISLINTKEEHQVCRLNYRHNTYGEPNAMLGRITNLKSMNNSLVYNPLLGRQVFNALPREK